MTCPRGSKAERVPLKQYLNAILIKNISGTFVLVLRPHYFHSKVLTPLE